MSFARSEVVAAPESGAPSWAWRAVSHCALGALLVIAACGGRSADPFLNPRVDAGCTAGTACTPAGSSCRTGAADCSTGTATCEPIGDAPNGTACGNNAVCLAGQCTSCTAGASCAPQANSCRIGTISCATGQATCSDNGVVPDGTACDAGLCCGGLCHACSPPAHATPTCGEGPCTFVCDSGFTRCGDACFDTTSDDRACGASCEVCPMGTSCIDSACQTEFGYSSPFSPCSTTASVDAFAAGYLVAQRLSIPAAITVTNLGVIGNMGGAHGILALYADSGGAPSTLVTETASTSIASGDNRIPVTTSVRITAGSYWIAGEYDATSSICVDYSQDNPLDYVTVSSYGAVPQSFGNSTAISSVEINYYVAGTE